MSKRKKKYPSKTEARAISARAGLVALNDRIAPEDLTAHESLDKAIECIDSLLSITKRLKQEQEEQKSLVTRFYSEVLNRSQTKSKLPCSERVWLQKEIEDLYDQMFNGKTPSTTPEKLTAVGQPAQPQHPYESSGPDSSPSNYLNGKSGFKAAQVMNQAFEEATKSGKSSVPPEDLKVDNFLNQTSQELDEIEQKKAEEAAQTDQSTQDHLDSNDLAVLDCMAGCAKAFSKVVKAKIREQTKQGSLKNESADSDESDDSFVVREFALTKLTEAMMRVNCVQSNWAFGSTSPCQVFSIESFLNMTDEDRVKFFNDSFPSFPGSRFSIELNTLILNMYANSHTAINRIPSLEMFPGKIGHSTIAYNLAHVHSILLAPLAEILKCLGLGFCLVLEIDDTTFRIRSIKRDVIKRRMDGSYEDTERDRRFCKTQYVLGFVTPYHHNDGIAVAVYEVLPNRSRAAIARRLMKFGRVVVFVSDRAGAFVSLSKILKKWGILWQHCFAHLNRESLNAIFSESMLHYTVSDNCEEFMALVQKLTEEFNNHDYRRLYMMDFCKCIHLIFRVEQIANNCSKEEVLELRQKYSLPILSIMEDLALKFSSEMVKSKDEEGNDRYSAIDSSNKVVNALCYYLNSIPQFKTFIHYAETPVSSNNVEQILREVKYFTNNSSSFETLHGAEIFLALMSVSKTLKMNHINFTKFISKAFSQISSYMHLSFIKQLKATGKALKNKIYTVRGQKADLIDLLKGFDFMPLIQDIFGESLPEDMRGKKLIYDPVSIDQDQISYIDVRTADGSSVGRMLDKVSNGKNIEIPGTPDLPQN